MVDWLFVVWYLCFQFITKLPFKDPCECLWMIISIRKITRKFLYDYKIRQSFPLPVPKKSLKNVFFFIYEHRQ